jgi:hypothetical protein
MWSTHASFPYAAASCLRLAAAAAKHGCRLAVRKHGAKPRIEPAALRGPRLGNELGERTDASGHCAPFDERPAAALERALHTLVSGAACWSFCSHRILRDCVFR